MTRWNALPLPGALLLCTFLTAPALASSPSVQRSAASAPRPASALVVAHVYFNALRVGMQAGDFSTLASAYTDHATLVLRTPFAQGGNAASMTIIHGRAGIERAYQSLRPALLGCRWSRLRFEGTSQTHVMSYQYAW